MDYIIDKDKLTNVVFSKFLNDIQWNNDEYISSIPMYIMLSTSENVLELKTIKEIQTVMFNELLVLVETLSDDDTITLIVSDNDTSITFTKYDLSWWSKTASRQNKLFGEETKKPKTKKEVEVVEKTIKCGIKNIETNDVTDIVEFTSSKSKEFVEFINKQITEKSINYFFERETHIIVFSITNEWYTVDELVEKEIFKLDERAMK